MVGLHHSNPLEVVETAVEMVDLAWNAIERHRHHVAHDGAVSELEIELERERWENRHLRVALEECDKVLEEVQRLQKNAKEIIKDSSGASVAHQCPNPPSDFCEQLKKKIDFPAFLEKLKELNIDKVESTDSLVRKSGDDMMVNSSPEDPSCWQWITDDPFFPEPIEESGFEESSFLDKDTYIIVRQDDVVEGMAFFLARAIYSNPHSKSMAPRELLEALSLSFARMEANGTLWKLWDVVKLGYITASWSVAVYGIYKHPVILRAVFKVISSSCRFLLKVLA